MLCNLNPSEQLVEQSWALIWSAADGATWLHVSVLALYNRLEASTALTDELGHQPTRLSLLSEPELSWTQMFEASL